MTTNNKKLLLMLGLFVLPVVLAKLALDNDWFNRGATNKGELVAPGTNVGDISHLDKPQWKLIYVVPEKCDAECENALLSMNQVWLALGRENDRLTALAVTTSTSDLSPEQLTRYPHIIQHEAEAKRVDSAFNQLNRNSIFIVDTLDNVVLRYDLFKDQKAAVMKSREMLADIKKLLKLSRIG